MIGLMTVCSTVSREPNREVQFHHLALMCDQNLVAIEQPYLSFTRMVATLTRKKTIRLFTVDLAHYPGDIVQPRLFCVHSWWSYSVSSADESADQPLLAMLLEQFDRIFGSAISRTFVRRSIWSATV